MRLLFLLLKWTPWLLLLGFAVSRVGRLPSRRTEEKDPVSTARRQCSRVSCYALIVPGLVILSVLALLVHRVNGGPGLLAYSTFFTYAGRAWIATSIVGLLFAIRASHLARWSGDELILIVLHVISLAVVFIAPMLRYSGNPD